MRPPPREEGRIINEQMYGTEKDRELNVNSSLLLGLLVIFERKKQQVIRNNNNDKKIANENNNHDNTILVTVKTFENYT